MSLIRQLLGLSLFKREPWRFPETKVTGKSSVIVGNSRILRRDSSTSVSKFIIDKEVISGLALGRSGQSQDAQGEKIPLHVKLRGDHFDTKTILSRKRNLTRVGGALNSKSKLGNVFALKGTINSEQALSVGYAAVELGIRYLRISAPQGKDSIEQLRIVRTIATRFDLLLIIAVSSPEDLNFCLNWSDVIELEISRDSQKGELLRRVVNSEKSLALRRSHKLTLEEFVRVTSALQLESAKEFIIFESGTQYSSQIGVASFNVGMIQRLKEKTGAEVILDLTQSDRNAPLSVQLSGVASGVNGIVIQFDHTQATASFDELQTVVQKLEALKYTLDAISQIA